MEHLGDIPRLVVYHVQVIAIDIDDHRGGFAGDGFADAVAQERDHFAVDAREAVQHVAQIVHQLGLHLARNVFFQLDVKFASVRLPGVLALFGAADLHLRRGYLLLGQKQFGDLAAEAQHFRQGSSGDGLDLEDEMPFAKIRQVFAPVLVMRKQQPTQSTTPTASSARGQWETKPRIFP